MLLIPYICLNKLFKSGLIRFKKMQIAFEKPHGSLWFLGLSVLLTFNAGKEFTHSQKEV